jgi:hypothetical protein
MITMPASVGLLFWKSPSFASGASPLSLLEDLTLAQAQESLAKIRGGLTRLTKKISAGCALALAFACIAPNASAQAEAGTVSPANKTGGVKTANPKKHVKYATKASAANTTTSPRKAHPASHPTAGKHPKSNAASAARNSKANHASPHKNSKKKSVARGQQKIEPERAQAIQEALIREHYLSAEATGTWNQASEDAMRRYQADHGWQSKTVPDSRALISLGLGPSRDHLLNPESAMTMGPEGPRAASLRPVSHSADPGVRMNNNPTPPVDSESTANPNRNQ